MYEFLNELNEAQREAVVNYSGASLVIAGAGSGKTRVLTYRIAYLLAKEIPARQILALTFTNKAAAEMKSRIAKMAGNDVARFLWMGTFHSIFARILRNESGKLGYSSNYTIYDPIDTKSLIKKIIKELNLDDKIYKSNEVYGRISSAKNNLITAKAYSSNNQIIIQDQKNNRSRITDIYTIYSNRCKKADAMDFDDLLLNTNILFRDFPEVLEKYQNMFKYILVDEYQDTNFAQYLIVNKLSSKNKNICVVGDDAQSIYSFRGAKIENILNFKNDYPGYKLFKLEQNYRSTQTIVNAANSLIKKNKEQIPKKVFSANSVGEKIKVVEAETDKDEAYKIARIIQDVIEEKNYDNKDFAILYRTNAQSRSFEEAFRRFNIPYKVYGSISFYQRKEIKDILAYFRLSINHNDEEALTRVINYPARGIGQTTLERIEETAKNENLTTWDILTQIQKNGLGLNSGTQSKLNSFKELIEKFSEGIKQNDAYDAAILIAKESGIIDEFKNPESHEEQTRLENLEELLNGIKEFVDEQNDTDLLPTLDKYMENVALLTNQDNEKDDDFNKVTIMTIHSAKGLEFKHVFLVGLEEDLFPSSMSSGTQKELEEERRLCYVALTRAEETAVISFAKERYKWGVPSSCRPSRFIKEIDEQFLELPDSFLETPFPLITKNDLPGFSSKPKFIKNDKPGINGNLQSVNKRLVKISSNQNNHTNQESEIIPDDPGLIAEGMVVRHSKFGLGEVLQIEGVAPNSKATVYFEVVGEKQLLLKFAKLQIVKK
ncbi:MAG: ATP-dependent DNA helicase [Bacteroidetes bacterium GWC2_33_15]|nr:MAG: ATP-dependent DNA helicase [Bacteroidetes bacterium GWA2_33_15]OFX52470.1 MAG: ATP-dependent DNA helicase [Bacteroidetes bacterium GWC2_33_15]OFX65531.1 MAG: ATP-dependent DNA helicase [Bacteroidetes bacterium GWB2_32_14]OFX67552.1 MAG: ATP-dependent DNA helicase [Bacteroidetes bacterium GWD2_33_33]HAN18405.1 ATP-dependent DNA helicase [Bacteroidales bacterium]